MTRREACAAAVCTDQVGKVFILMQGKGKCLICDQVFTRWYDLIVILDDATCENYYAQLVEESRIDYLLYSAKAGLVKKISFIGGPDSVCRCSG